jgi:hypothetical protein
VFFFRWFWTNPNNFLKKQKKKVIVRSIKAVGEKKIGPKLSQYEDLKNK